MIKTISHATCLFWIQDNLIFHDANIDQFASLSWTLIWFEAISRLRINLRKKKLNPTKGVSNVEELVLVLSSQVKVLVATYLDLLLGAPFKTTSVSA